MKNFDKYSDELIATRGNICDFVIVHKIGDCENMSCATCREHLFRWLNEEYEPQIDWSKVLVDTPIIVTDNYGKKFNRYFKEYSNGRIAYFIGGATSWSSNNEDYPKNMYVDVDKIELALDSDKEKYTI